MSLQTESIFKDGDATTLHPKYHSISSIGEEVVHNKELNKLLLNNPNIIAYDGFERPECIYTRLLSP